MSLDIFFVISNLAFALTNLWFALYGPYPRFSALCFGICSGATMITLYFYMAV